MYAQSCPTFCDPIDCSLPGFSCPWNFPDKNTGGGGLLAKSCPTLVTPWTVAPMSMEFSRQEHWSGLSFLSPGILEWGPFPTPGGLPYPGIKPTSLASPALAGGFFTTVPPGNP